MKLLQIDWSRRRGATAEYARRTIQKLRPPGRDLVRVNIELLRQLRQRLLAPPIAANATFALKAPLWFRRARLVILSP